VVYQHKTIYRAMRRRRGRKSLVGTVAFNSENVSVRRSVFSFLRIDAYLYHAIKPAGRACAVATPSL